MSVGQPNKPRVLLVDDEEALLRAFSRMLTAAGFEVTSCADGATALTKLAEGRFDAIVSDVNMPGMNGTELLRVVRNQDQDLPVILVTGAPSIDSAASAVNFGAFKYLMKPISRDDLVQSVERATQLYRLGALKREALQVLGTSSGEGSDRAGLEATFERTLASLWMAFQPIVRASDRSVFAYEALLRSDEPALPHPGAVLDAAERLGALDRLGRTARDRAAGPFAAGEPSWLLFVNLHPKDLEDDSLFDRHAPLAQIASRVVLEITERSSLENVGDLRGRVLALRDVGYRIAVDDLGAGYAGLASFVHLEPDFVKLDMSLVRDVHVHMTKQKLVRSMTALCKDMGLLVVAEGIETPEERDVLVELGCDLLQGYRFGRPSKPFVTPVW